MAGNEFQLFIVLTFVFGGTTFILLLVNFIAGKFLLGHEGWHFLKSRFSGFTLDNIRHEPLSNKLILGGLDWNGETFLNKIGIYYPLRAVMNPTETSKKIYNKAISAAPSWAGNGKPVIMTTDLMSFAISPGFFSKLAQAKNPLDEKTKKFVDKLQKIFDETGVEYFTFIETFDIKDVQSILKDVGAKKVKDSFKKGVNAEKLKNTKLPGQGGVSLPWIGVAVVVVLVIAYFAQKWIASGGLA